MPKPPLAVQASARTRTAKPSLSPTLAAKPLLLAAMTLAAGIATALASVPSQEPLSAPLTTLLPGMHPDAVARRTGWSTPTPITVEEGDPETTGVVVDRDHALDQCREIVVRRFDGGGNRLTQIMKTCD